MADAISVAVVTPSTDGSGAPRRGFLVMSRTRRSMSPKSSLLGVAAYSDLCRRGVVKEYYVDLASSFAARYGLVGLGFSCAWPFSSIQDSCGPLWNLSHSAAADS